MKTKISIIAILTFFLATNVFAGKNFKFDITPLEAAKVLISINAEQSSRPSLTIVNESGRTIYNKKCKTAEYGTKQIFNFSKLENGNYEVRLTAGNTTLKNEVSIEDGVVTIKAQNKEIEPHFAFQDNLVKISYLNFEKSNVKAFVYKKGTLIHKAELGNDFMINKGLNISNLENGYYDLCLTNGDQNYWFSMKR